MCLKRVHQRKSLADFRSIRLWLEVKGALEEVHHPECYFEQDWEQTEEQTNVGRETAGFSRIWNFSCILLDLATRYADSSAQCSRRTAGSSVSLSWALCCCGPQGLQHKPTFARTRARWERFKSVSASPSNASTHVVQILRVMFSNYFWWVKYLIFLSAGTCLGVFQVISGIHFCEKQLSYQRWYKEACGCIFNVKSYIFSVFNINYALKKDFRRATLKWCQSISILHSSMQTIPTW